jgi:hypothetical protein
VRHLVDSTGRPFMIRGDAPWCLITQLKRDEVDRYLQTRRQQGFNAVLVELTEPKLCAHAPQDAYGAAPYRTPGDFTTPNEAYFAHADEVIAQAEAHGFVVLLTPAYTGYEGNDTGWYRQMTAAGAVNLRAYGRYVAQRLAARHNIIWVQGGDFDPPEKALVRAVAQGIRDVDPNALQTFHGGRQTAALAYWGTGESWLNVNDIYTSDATVVRHAFTEYRRSTVPYFLIEAHYENEHGADESVVRRQAYQALLSGASGHVMGNKPVWGFFPGWQAQLTSGGATTLAHLHRFFDAIPWWTLQPDMDSSLLRAGAGSGLQAVAAASADGRLAVAYTPSQRFLTCNLARLRGPSVDARWFDPTSGVYAEVPGSPFDAAGLRVFTPPGPNSRGYDDWVLLLQSTGH